MAQPLSRKVALQLPDNGAGGKCTELDAPINIEPIDRFDQAYGGHLNQVFVRFAPIGEPAGKLMSETEMLFDELVAETLVTALGILQERRPN